MPYKQKRKCNAQSGKQNKLITKRLMEISLKVDDYIYNNKQNITDRDAEKYIQEVAALKTCCSNDERCLQVIEKLTRIMKGIIAEQIELNAENSFNQNYTLEDSDQIRGAISPVYSTPDEDRTQFTEAIATHTDVAKDKEIIDLCNSDDENLQEDVKQIQSMVVDVEIHRGMSELSLTSFNRNTMEITSPADNECSQSILKHLENIEANGEGVEVIQIVGVPPSNEEGSQSILKNIEINDELVTSCIDRVCSGEVVAEENNGSELNVNKRVNPTVHNKVDIVTTDCIPKRANNMDPIPNTTNNILQCIDNAISTLNTTFNTPCAKKSILNSTATIIETGNKNNKIQENYNKNTTINNGSDNSNKTSCSKNYNSNNKDSSVTETYNTLTNVSYSKENDKNIPPNKQYKPVEANIISNRSANAKDVLVNQPVNKNKPRTTKKSHKKKTEEAVKKKKEIGKVALEKPPAKRAKNKNVKQPNKRIPIYKNNTENDLSWVENIRYVREIGNNEYEPQLTLEEDFWDNCSAPGMWKDQDFHC